MATGAISTGVSLLFILPAFTALYRWRFSRSDIKSNPIVASGASSERTPLLSDEEQVSANAASEPAPQVLSEVPSTLLSASQDLVVARISLAIDAISAVWISLVQTTLGVALGEYPQHADVCCG